jgi:hypothetical protein
MNDKTLRALDRALDRLERASQRERRRAGFSTAPIVLGLGLILGYQLLVRFVPRVWAALLPGGLEQAGHLGGWPGLVLRLAVVCHQHFFGVCVFMGSVVAAGLMLGRGNRLLRAFVWVAAVAVILLDAGIIYVVLRASMQATLEGAGFELPN